MKLHLLRIFQRLFRRQGNRRRRGGSTRLAVNVPLSRKEQRMKRHARNVRLARWGSIAVGVLVLGIYARSLWGQSFRGNPAFAVGQFEYHTNGGIAARDAAAAAGLRPDTNLMDVDLAAIRTRLLELPRVKSVAVERRLPDKFAITLEERLPVARIVSMKPERIGNVELKHALFVDRDGVAFKCEELREYVALPSINAVEQGVFTVGQEVPCPGMKVALLLLEQFRTRTWAAPCNVRSVEILNDWTVSVEMETGAQFVFRPENVARQLERLAYILAKSRAVKKSVATVNLQLERNVPVRFYEQLTQEVSRTPAPLPGQAVPLAEPVSFSPSSPPRAREVKPIPRSRAEHDRQTILRGN